jgi:hypothetical protein
LIVAHQPDRADHLVLRRVPHVRRDKKDVALANFDVVAAEVDLVSVVRHLPPAFEAFCANRALHKCTNCSAVAPGSAAAGRLGDPSP